MATITFIDCVFVFNLAEGGIISFDNITNFQDNPEDAQGYTGDLVNFIYDGFEFTCENPFTYSNNIIRFDGIYEQEYENYIIYYITTTILQSDNILNKSDFSDFKVFKTKKISKNKQKYDKILNTLNHYKNKNVLNYSKSLNIEIDIFYANIYCKYKSLNKFNCLDLNILKIILDLLDVKKMTNFLNTSNKKIKLEKDIIKYDIKNIQKIPMLYKNKEYFMPIIDNIIFGNDLNLGSAWMGIVRFNNNEDFANVIGSTGDLNIAGLSWIQLWRNQYGQENTCSSFNFSIPGPFACTTPLIGNIVGGHVVLGRRAVNLPYGSYCFIMPICKAHNNNDNVSMQARQYINGIWLQHYHNP